ncbi:MAG: hypothetical protein ACR2Q3_16495 [Woeseiaceae bacterium]
MPEPATAQGTVKWIDRVEWIIATTLQVGILLVIAGTVYRSEWLLAFNGTLILALTFAPAMLERRLRQPLPVDLTLITTVFLYAAFALGEVRDFYEKIWWWDLALHGLSVLTVGVIGFLYIYVFYMTRRIDNAPGWIATISFALAVSVGTLWEVFEILMDHYFAFNMQKSGLIDTMTDLIINAVGAVIAAAIGYFYVYGEDSLLGRRLIQAMAHEKKEQ